MFVIAISFLCTFLLGYATLSLALNRLANFASALPDERSNHNRPTPQIGGIALVPVVLLVIAATTLYQPMPVFSRPEFFVAVLILFVTGAVDDRWPLPPLAKLGIQFVACGLASLALREVLMGLPLPLVIAIGIATLFLVAIVNFTNFIDGLDLMAVAAIGVPSLTFSLQAVGNSMAAAVGPFGATIVGAMLAFAPINRPRARAFLGDAGSLPFGLMLGMMSIVAACRFDLVAGLLLPAYVLCDGTFTVSRRIGKGENVFMAHSSHVYQRAYRSGRSVSVIISSVVGFGLLTGLLAEALPSFGDVGRAVAIVAAIGLFGAMAKWLVRKPIIPNGPPV